MAVREREQAKKKQKLQRDKDGAVAAVEKTFRAAKSASVFIRLVLSQFTFSRPKGFDFVSFYTSFSLLIAAISPSVFILLNPLIFIRQVVSILSVFIRPFLYLSPQSQQVCFILLNPFTINSFDFVSVYTSFSLPIAAKSAIGFATRSIVLDFFVPVGFRCSLSVSFAAILRLTLWVLIIICPQSSSTRANATCVLWKSFPSIPTAIYGRTCMWCGGQFRRHTYVGRFAWKFM